MPISLILIGLISLVVISGTGYLFINKNEELPEPKKAKILVIVGAVVFLSFLITTFKHRNIQFVSRPGQQTIDINKVFYGQGCSFSHKVKYQNLKQIQPQTTAQFYARNYESIDQRVLYQEDTASVEANQQKILYYSKKDQGASFFLSSLATYKCSNKKTPVVYLKLQKNIKNAQEFFRTIGVPSYQHFRKRICHLAGVQIKNFNYNIQYQRVSSNNLKPYIIIDNFEHIISTLITIRPEFDSESEGNDFQNDPNKKSWNRVSRQRLISSIMNDIVDRCGVNIVLNTEKASAIQQMYEIMEDHRHSFQGRNKQNKASFPFQYHRWQSINQYDIYKIISKTVSESDNIVSRLLKGKRKEHYTFKELSFLLQAVKHEKEESSSIRTINQQDLGLAETQNRQAVAKYYGLQSIWSELKKTENRKVGYLKSKIRWNQIEELQSLGLVEIDQGSVKIK